MKVITGDTVGFTVVVEHESGGCIGTWVPDLDEAHKHIKRVWDDKHTYIRVFPSRYDERMRLK